MRARLALALLAVPALLALPASAAAAPVVIDDLAGDANLANGQIFSGPDGAGFAGPGSQAGRDIVKVELKNTFVKQQCTGFTMTMTLSGPPAADSRFRLSGGTEVNTDFFIVEHDSGTGETGIRYGGPGEDETLPLKAAVVKGSTITWTVTTKQLRAIGEEAGNEVTGMLATTTASVEGMLFFPIFDKAPGGEKTFAFCR